MKRIGEMTHDELVRRAARWLKNTARCQPVFTEQMTLSESPDAIGWTWKGSILIECKTSLSDFHADKKKPFREDGFLGVGRQRFYMAPPEIINDNAFRKTRYWHYGWGLLEVKGNIVRVVQQATIQPEYSKFGEIRLLRAAAMNGRPDLSLPEELCDIKVD